MFQKDDGFGVKTCEDKIFATIENNMVTQASALISGTDPVAATTAVFGDVWGHQAGQRCVNFTCSSLRKLGRAFDTMI